MKKIQLLILLCLTIFLVSCSKEVQVSDYQFYAMDTFITIRFYDVDNSEEIGKMVEEIYLKYDEVASDFHTGYGVTNVYDLNEKRTGEVNDALLELIHFSIRMQQETNGYFNPFIGGLSHLWKENLDQKTLPTSEEVEVEVAKMNQTSVQIKDHIVTLEGEGNLDLGGIAKGYATQKAQEYLDSISCSSFLLNAGSSNIVLGQKKTEAFKVGLSKGFNSGYYTTLTLKDCAISTSSIKEQHVWIEDHYYSHLLNPKTGYPADFYETFSIIGLDSGILDAYSTACFAMNLEEAKAFLAEKNLDYICSKNNELLDHSSGVILQ